MRVIGPNGGATDKAQDISNAGRAGVVRESGGEKRKPAKIPGSSGADEKVAISPKGKDALKAKQIAQSTPDVDEAKVARLREMVQNNAYKVDTQKVADALVDEHLGSILG